MCLNNLTQRQIDYLLDHHRYVILPAGRRSRKTLISKRKVLIEGMYHPEHKYFHGAPTRQQAKDIFWKDLKKYTKLFWGKIPNESELYVTLWNGTEIHVVGLDRAERIEGQEWHGCHITEIGNVKPMVWDENISPVLSDTKGFALLDGVPEGRNHYYDMALRATDGALPKTEPIIGAYHDCEEFPEWAYFSWFSSDVLDADEINLQRKMLDPKTYRQEYEGAFESFEGLAYYTFGQHNLFKSEYRKDVKVSVGMDFNVNPMTCTLGHIIKNVYYQFGERYLPNSNTYEIRDNLLETFPPHQIEIYPDSTGKARESNATESDIAILKKAGFTIKAKSRNPYVKDRVNSVNSFIKNDPQGDTRFKINPETCPKTINDLNKVERLDDGRLNKAQEERRLKHITDALGYLIHFNWPAVRNEVYTTERH